MEPSPDNLFVVVETNDYGRLHHFWMKSFPTRAEAKESARTNPSLGGNCYVWTVARLLRELNFDGTAQ